MQSALDATSTVQYAVDKPPVGNLQRTGFDIAKLCIRFSVNHATPSGTLLAAADAGAWEKCSAFVDWAADEVTDRSCALICTSALTGHPCRQSEVDSGPWSGV